MKKLGALSLILAAILQTSYADTSERMRPIVGIAHIEDHMDESAMEENGSMRPIGGESFQRPHIAEDHDAQGSVQSEGGRPHSILSLVESDMLPEDIRPIAHEIEKATKFYKHPEFFEDLNITDPAMLADPIVQEKVREKVQEAQHKRAQEIAHKLFPELAQSNPPLPGAAPKKALPIAGEFVKIGEGAFDWVFVTQGGRVFKLDGVDANGNFKYRPLENLNATIGEDGKVHFEGEGPYVVMLHDQALPGYPFAQYGDPEENGFDWLIALPNGRVFKLEGYDSESGSFVYTPVDGVEAEQNGSDVVLLPGTAQ